MRTMVEPTQELSLFEDYKRRQPDLGFGFGGGILTEEGAGIFASHIRVEETRHLSRVLGGLAYGRSEKPLEAPVTVAETITDSEDLHDRWMLTEAAGGVLDHLVAIEATSPDAIAEREVDGIVTREARLITGNYVSVQIADGAKIVLSPTSTI